MYNVYLREDKGAQIGVYIYIYTRTVGYQSTHFHEHEKESIRQ